MGTVNVKEQYALITGASSGIGASLAQFLALKGIHVLLSARRASKLLDIQKEIINKGGASSIFPADLSSEKERERLFKQISDHIGSIDVLVNNAGFGWYGYFADMPWQVAKQMIDVNVAAAVHLSSLFIHQFIQQGKGHIINISSIAGGLPNQGIAVYSASKAFLDAFSTASYREYHKKGVDVSSVRLGPVDTEFYEQARSQPNGRRVPAERFAISTKRVNQAVWRLLRHPRRTVYIPGWLSLTRFVDPIFGWLIDMIGPLLLRRKERQIKGSD